MITVHIQTAQALEYNANYYDALSQGYEGTFYDNQTLFGNDGGPLSALKFFSDYVEENLPEHSYDEQDYTWAEDYSACTATFTCMVCGDVQTVDCTVTSDTTAATCGSAGETVYTAKVTFAGAEYTDTKTVEIPATGNHSYGEPVYTWAEDCSTCTATFTCGVCGDEQTVDCTVTSGTTAATCGSAGETVYTAKATFEGTEYTGTQTVAIPATDSHSYGNPTYIWSSGYDTCTASFTCGVCSDRQTVDCTVTSDTTPATCGSAGETVYTAKATFEGTEYTGTQTVAIPATGNHSYGEPTYSWAEDYSICTATFTCDVCGDEQTVDCTVTSDTTPATCGSAGETVYTAKATFAGTEYTGTKTVEIPATGNHSYGEPTYSWTEDYGTCMAKFTCAVCGDEQTVDCTVTSNTTSATCGSVGETVYTAKVTFEGTEYTGTQTVAIPATGSYSYGNPTYIWSSGYATCTASFTCGVCSDRQTVDCIVTSDTTLATCGSAGETVYTAKATFEGTEYTGTQTVDIPATGLPDQDFPDGLDHMVSIQVGITEVPEALQGNEELNSAEKIETALQTVLIEHCGYPKDNMVIYEVTLMVSEDGGLTWKEATTENFPESGLTIMLSYPDGYVQLCNKLSQNKINHSGFVESN